jgi:hypothetical protein
MKERKYKFPRVIFCIRLFPILWIKLYACTWLIKSTGYIMINLNFSEMTALFKYKFWKNGAALYCFNIDVANFDYFTMYVSTVFM